MRWICVPIRRIGEPLAREERGAWRKSDHEECGCGDAGQYDCQAAGEDVIVAHLSCLIVLAIPPLCFVNGQMGTDVLDEHC